MKRLPPGPFAARLAVTAFIVWGVTRALLTSGLRVVARELDISPNPSPGVLLILAVAVSWVVLRDITRSRERVFAQNLGIAPVTVMGVALGTVVLCEAAVALLPVLLAPWLGAS